MIKLDTTSPTAPTAHAAGAKHKAFKGMLQAAQDATASLIGAHVARAAAPPAKPATDATDATAVTATAATAGHAQSPIAALVAATVGRAIGSLRGTTAGTPAVATGAAPTPAATPPEATADAAEAGAQATAMTPLEQAIHDLLGAAAITRDAAPADDRREPAHDDEHAPPALSALALPAATTDSDAPAPTPVHAAQAAAPIAPPEPPANPSHVHLILDDGPERVVMTVAVRGSDVHVALRGTDETTTAALARNAAALEHAMRGRGLQLAEFSAEPDHGGHSRHDAQPQPDPRRERRDDSERFTLEEPV